MQLTMWGVSITLVVTSIQSGGLRRAYQTLSAQIRCSMSMLYHIFDQSQYVDQSPLAVSQVLCMWELVE